MKKGNSVKVKEGIMSPDFDDLEIGGWQGRVMDVNEEFVTFAFDSQTLESLPDFYIQESIVEDFDFGSLCLEKNELELTKPRDTEADVERAYRNIEINYSIDEIEKRIQSILGTTDIYVTEENQAKYLKYLKNNLKSPILLTGSEDFDWEEPYVMGIFPKKEYTELKKTRASYTDKFDFIKMSDDWDDWKGLRAKVKRVSDGKKFEIPLWDLKIVYNNETSTLLIADYSIWMTNYQ